MDLPCYIQMLTYSLNSLSGEDFAPRCVVLRYTVALFPLGALLFLQVIRFFSDDYKASEQ